MFNFLFPKKPKPYLPTEAEKFRDAVKAAIESADTGLEGFTFCVRSPIVSQLPNWLRQEICTGIVVGFNGSFIAFGFKPGGLERLKDMLVLVEAEISCAKSFK